MTQKKTRHKAGDIDRAVAINIKRARIEAGLSVMQAASALKRPITHQQYQKYESGASRVSAGTLFDMARVLRKPIESFFVGVDQVEMFPKLPRSPSLIQHGVNALHQIACPYTLMLAVRFLKLSAAASKDTPPHMRRS